MARTRRWHLWSGILGGLVAALVMSALPAIADTVGELVGTQAVLSPGDPIQAGRVNEIDKTTWLRGTWTNSMLKLVNDGKGPALELNTASDVAPLAVASKKLVKGLNVDRVDNRHANQFIRAAGARAIGLPNEGGDLLTTSIVAPYPGLLVMGGSVDTTGTLDTDGSGGAAIDDLFFCRLVVDDVDVPGTVRWSRVHDAGGIHTNNDTENCSTDGIAMVDAGIHSVDYNIGSHETATVHGGSLWVLWVGFDGQGLKPTESSIVTLDAPAGDGPARHIQDG